MSYYPGLLWAIANSLIFFLQFINAILISMAISWNEWFTGVIYEQSLLEPSSRFELTCSRISIQCFSQYKTGGSETGAMHFFQREMLCLKEPGEKFINSRHSSAKTYFVFIVAERNMNGWYAIRSYCCDCIVGLRTVGCCSHVMSIIWYFSYARHEGLTRPAPYVDDVRLRIN